MTEHNAGHRDYVTCPNRRCLDGGYPWWDSDDKEVECPTCHGEGVVLAETTSSTLVSLRRRRSPMADLYPCPHCPAWVTTRRDLLDAHLRLEHANVRDDLLPACAQAVVEVEPFGSVSGGRVAAAVLDAIEAAGYAIVRRSAERPTSCDPLGGHVPNCTCAEDNAHYPDPT